MSSALQDREAKPSAVAVEPVSVRTGAAVPTIADTADASSATSKRTGHRLGLALVLVAAGLVSLPGLLHERITGLDQAHHIASGIFFCDALRDLPVGDPVGYTFDYYRQYPALGFTFWPPVYHAASGVLMTLLGPGVLTARLTLALFTALLAGSFYLVLRRTCSPLLAALGGIALVTTPLMVELETGVMLEVPMTALCCVTLAAYFRLIDRGAWSGWGEVVIASILCGLIVYTKQPGVFLFPALLVDLAWNHRGLLKTRKTWAMLGLVVVWCLPLALFTLKFGRVNLEQSFGNAGNIYVAEHRVAERWSIDGWMYYLRETAAQVHPVVLLLALLGGVVLLASPEWRRRQGVWLAWIGGWYLLFTLFDNKQPRFVSAVLPGLIALGAVAVELLRSRSAWLGWTGVCLLAGVVAVQGRQVQAHALQGYPGLDQLTGELVRPDLDGHLLFFGADYQLFVPWVRLLDESRQVHVLRGDDLLEESGSLAKAMTDYRVRYVLVDPETPAGEAFTAARDVTPEAPLELLRELRFDNGLKEFRVDLYAHRGPVAETMARIPLGSQVHGVSVE